MLNALELTGREATHVTPLAQSGPLLHRDIIDAFQALTAAAASDGIDIEIISGYRDFAGQCRIWNAKYRGERPLYDELGRVRDPVSLNERQRIAAILCWSALPGASRHHWGTDLDIIDRAAMPEGYKCRLMPGEYEPRGVFHRLNVWIERNAARHGFFRPYEQYRGGVYPEPWHISHAAISTLALRALTPDVIEDALKDGEVMGAERVLTHLPEIYERYISNICPPSASASTAVAST